MTLAELLTFLRARILKMGNEQDVLGQQYTVCFIGRNGTGLKVELFDTFDGRGPIATALLDPDELSFAREEHRRQAGFDPR